MAVLGGSKYDTTEDKVEWARENPSAVKLASKASQAEYRNRRERPRMSDITRAVDKVVDEDYVGACVPGATLTPVTREAVEAAGKTPDIYALCTKDQIQTWVEWEDGKEGVKITGTDKPCTYGNDTVPVVVEFDRNSPSALKQLRWELYKLMDDYCLSDTVKMKIEDLFKEYTNS